MKNRKLRITEKDFLLANRRASRAEEIERHGKQISMRKLTHKSKKVYDRKRLKRAGINSNDDLPIFYYCNNAGQQCENFLKMLKKKLLLTLVQMQEICYLHPDKTR